MTMNKGPKSSTSNPGFFGRVISQWSTVIALSGVTLIETVIYIALLGLIMTGALTAAYNLVGAASQNSGSTAVAEEGSFVARKISWALADLSSEPVVSGVGCAQKLSVTKEGYGYNPVEFRRNAASSSVEMREGGAGVWVPLTTRNVSATCLQFGLQSEPGLPAGVAATTTIDDTEFSVIKYMRI